MEITHRLKVANSWVHKWAGTNQRYYRFSTQSRDRIYIFQSCTDSTDIHNLNIKEICITHPLQNLQLTFLALSNEMSKEKLSFGIDASGILKDQ